MIATVLQVAPGKWPSGEGHAVGCLRLSPDELSRRLNIRFETGCDDMDEYELAAIEDRRVGQVWLFRYQTSPRAGTEVWVDDAISLPDATAAIERLGLGGIPWEWTLESP